MRDKGQKHSHGLFFLPAVIVATMCFAVLPTKNVSKKVASKDTLPISQHPKSRSQEKQQGLVSALPFSGKEGWVQLALTSSTTISILSPCCCGVRLSQSAGLTSRPRANSRESTVVNIALHFYEKRNEPKLRTVNEPFKDTLPVSQHPKSN